VADLNSSDSVTQASTSAFEATVRLNATLCGVAISDSDLLFLRRSSEAIREILSHVADIPVEESELTANDFRGDHRRPAE
jgi:hypothetical protein